MSIESKQIKFSDQLHEAWATVELSRHPQRPHSLDFFNRIFSSFEELHGDRTFGDDGALIGGLAKLRGNADFPEELNVVFLGHQKGRSTKQKIERNFGMARPEGYRKAQRLMDLANRFQLPVLSVIDTPGAYPGIDAEERGQSEAIASSIQKMYELEVPSISVVIGEGGSGGALAIGVPDRLRMVEKLTYSVISRESCAAILWGKSGEAKRAAVAMKMSAKENFRLGICDEIVKESGRGAHENFDEVASNLLGRLRHHFFELGKLSGEERKKIKYDRVRNIDRRARQLNHG